MQLIIGNKNYSSWSMRPWIMLKHYRLDFDEVRIPMFVEGFQERLAQYSPSLKVPVLIDNDLTIWESLAICEYLSDRYLDGAGLPSKTQQRALCRSSCSEMHAGFQAIRSQLPMNCRARRALKLSPEVVAEVRRIDQLWQELRQHRSPEGEYLLGEFSMADCMFAPVVMRFRTYGVELSDASEAYMETMIAHPAVQAWCRDAEAETEVIENNEAGEPR